MVKFLVTLLLAIIIFAPACVISSKFFRLSSQAKENFGDFVNEIKEVASSGEGERRSKIIIMDKKTAIVYFEKHQKEVIVEVDVKFPLTDYTIHLNKPSQCANEKNCICLFRDPEFDVTWWKPGYDAVTVDAESAICKNLDFSLSLADCGIGTSYEVHSYTCLNGFMIERHLADESSWAVSSYYEAARRLHIEISHEENYILLKEIK